MESVSGSVSIIVKMVVLVKLLCNNLIVIATIPDIMVSENQYQRLRITICTKVINAKFVIVRDQTLVCMENVS